MKTPKRRKFCRAGVFIFDFLIYYGIYNVVISYLA